MSFGVNIGDQLELRVYCHHAGAKQVAVNTYHVHMYNAEGALPKDSEVVAGVWAEAIEAAYKACLDSSATFAGVSVQDFPARQYVPSFSSSEAGAGTVVGNDCPTQVSGLISWRTNYAGGSGRGRSYIPFPSNTSNGADGLPTVGYQTSLQALADILSPPLMLVVELSNTYWNLIIVPAAGGTGNKVVQEGIAVRKWATQRRRGSYGRPNELPVALQ